KVRDSFRSGCSPAASVRRNGSAGAGQGAAPWVGLGAGLIEVAAAPAPTAALPSTPTTIAPARRRPVCTRRFLQPALGLVNRGVVHDVSRAVVRRRRLHRIPQMRDTYTGNDFRIPEDDRSVPGAVEQSHSSA